MTSQDTRLKQCSRCKKDKELKDFYRNSSSSDGYKSLCKNCEKDGKKTIYSKDYYRNRSLVARYGITLEEYNKMLKSQHSKCGICGIHEKHCDKKLAVDHDHTTGLVRKLLCQHCNTGLGQFRDNKEFLAKAISYLEEHK